MWRTGYAPRWLARDNPARVPMGPAMTTLRSVIARIACLTRCAGIVYVLLQLAIWHSFYAASPGRLAGPALVTAWTIAAVSYLGRLRPMWTFACVDTAVYVVLALTCQGCVPPATRGEAASWLVIVMSSQLIVPAWYAPVALSVPLALASPAAYLIGVARAGGAEGGRPPAVAAVLIMISIVHWYSRRKLYILAARADAALAEVDREASEQYVVLSRNIERREHERLLHDTVLNTLTALARTGPRDVAQAVGRCRHDVALIESALSDSGDVGQDAGGGPYGPLIGGVRAVAAVMLARGLKVHVEVGADVPAEGGVSVPAAVAAAIAHAVREALSNVAAHAGTGEAWIEIGPAEPAGVRVTVRDEGAGFDPARIDQARLGLRRSITERIADWGGDSWIRSAPGQGTAVYLCWPARPGHWPVHGVPRQERPSW
jgi:signal transduction histidine kinase